MPKKKQKKIFISYSQSDGNRVYPLVELLRTTGAEVFLDIDSIEYGEQWEKVLEDSVRAAGRFLIFWSKNAAQSEYVKREYLLAKKVEVRIIPVLIDDTPLPPVLAQFQALTDLPPLLDRLEKTPPTEQRFSPGSWKILLPIVLLIILLVFDSNITRVFIVALVVLLIVILTGKVSSISSLSTQVDEMLFSDFDADSGHSDHDDHGGHSDHD